MKNHSPIVVGLDIGTTKICTVIARRNEFGKVEVLGVGQAPSLGVMRGVISNIDKTVDAITRSFAEAQRVANIDIDIRDVYVGIAGQHIKCYQHRAYMMRQYSEDEIRQRDIERLVSDMEKVAIPPGDQILHIIPQEFIVDDEQGIKDPIGMSGTRLEADFRIITGQTAAIRNIYRCVERANLHVAGLYLEPIASAGAVLTDEELEAGVAIVDIGGGTTDVAIFHEGLIRHTAVIPLGGNIITEDVKEGCMVMRDQAEKLKVKFGAAQFHHNEVNAIVSIPGLRGREPREISFRNLANIIQARMEEILEYVYYQIKDSGYETKLIGGIVITGGGARLKHLKNLTEQVTGLDTRIGLPTEHLINGRGQLNDPLYATSIGLAIKALQHPQVQQQQQTLSPPIPAAAEALDTNMSQSLNATEQNATPAKKNWFDSVMRKGREWLEGDIRDFE